jgi:hypothetical protein
MFTPPDKRVKPAAFIISVLVAATRRRAYAPIVRLTRLSQMGFVSLILVREPRPRVRLAVRRGP